jgi:hypothetical protein
LLHHGAGPAVQVLPVSRLRRDRLPEISPSALVFSPDFKYHLCLSLLIGFAHDGSAKTSNFAGSAGTNGICYRGAGDFPAGISPATARRDINKLDESGKLKKVRNGAEAISEQRPRWSPMNIHQAQNHDEKVRIARAASQLVAPGESIVINCGSTAFLLGRNCAANRCRSSPTICRWPTT